SKQHLLFELVSIGHEVHRDRIRAALLDAGREPAAQIAAITRAHVLAHLEFPGLARITNREVRNLSEEQRAAILLTRSDAERAFLDVIERGLRLGEFRAPEPMLAVYAVGGMGVRAAEWWTEDSTFTAEQVADTYADFAVRLLT
ncbi:MAG: putative transcriptional regulator, TetR family, partial [Frankiales bacterium]|nr:putative transcriptional regulator, TetR family [Frankiales bacterium]